MYWSVVLHIDNQPTNIYKSTFQLAPSTVIVTAKYQIQCHYSVSFYEGVIRRGLTRMHLIFEHLGNNKLKNKLYRCSLQSTRSRLRTLPELASTGLLSCLSRSAKTGRKQKFENDTKEK